uniref:Serpentine receptor class gamma n=1 Tax=Caenorhabditis tropicalis TaxID=1561998 RepID=A0A1I7V262_9PELO
MFDTTWIYKYIPRVFGTLAFIVNPIFVYLVFTEKTAKLGNYRYVLLYFAVLNLVYSVANVAIPIVSY